MTDRDEVDSEVLRSAASADACLCNVGGLRRGGRSLGLERCSKQMIVIQKTKKKMTADHEVTDFGPFPKMPITRSPILDAIF